MKYYRLYYLDSTGHVRQAVEFTCPDDHEAVAKVDEHRDGRPMELWSLDRRVGVFATASGLEAR